MEAVELLGYPGKNANVILLQGLKAVGNKDEGKVDFSAVETKV